MFHLTAWRKVMSKRLETVVTFAVKLKLPPGSNASDAQQYIIEAMLSHGGGGRPEDPFFHLDKDSFTVALRKRETTYG